MLLDVVIKEFGHLVPNATRKRLLRFWDEVPLFAITRDACWAYADWRDDQEDPRNLNGTPTVTTVNVELSLLRNMVNRYCAARRIDPVPTVYMLPPRRSSRGFLRVREVDRLLKATEGRVWDPDSGDWRRLPSGEYDLNDAAWRARVWPMRRMILLCIWTGSRPAVVRRATWDRRPDRPWIDLRVGNLHRRGATEPLSKKRAPPVRLTRALMTMAQAWREQDAARGHGHVVHDLGGAELGKSQPWKLFGLVREAAGLPEDVTLRTLRASCAVWLMENGCTPEQAAAFLGNTAHVLSRFYDRYAPEFSHAAADALDSRSYAPATEPGAAREAAMARRDAPRKRDR